MSGPTQPTTRERLLQSATDLFYSEGYGVSIDVVADHAGVAKPTVYAHFKSKESLIEAALQSVSDRFFVDLDVELDKRDGDVQRQIAAPFDLLAKDLPENYHGCLCINSAATFPFVDHPARRVLKEHDDKIFGIFRDIAKRAGVNKADSLARQCVVLYDGAKARGLSDQSGSATKDAKAAATALLRAATTA